MVKEPLYKQHGTYNCYTGPLQCRCDACKQAMAAYWQKYNERNGITPKPPKLFDCKVCAATFTGVGKRSYCSIECRLTALRNKRRCRCCHRRFPAIQDSGRIKRSLCAQCQILLADDDGRCGLCGIRWWGGDGDHFCSDECRNLDAVRLAIIEEDYL